MKTEAEIKERIADLKAELRGFTSTRMTSEVYIDYECMRSEIAALNWVLK
jgi:hypothetical protein